MLPEFPQLHPFLTTELVRNETKYSLDLRQLNPALICATAVRPVAVDLCLLARHESPDTRIKPATRTEVMSAIIENSIYYDTATAWRRNLTPIERLVKGVQGHHLIIGTAAEGIVAAVNNLIGE
jgi:hypothetical protein